jgi:hypothetical protein
MQPAQTRASPVGLLASIVLPLSAGCYASNVVAPEDRAVAGATLPTTWRPARAGDLRGLYMSVAISGDAALSLRRVWYWFEADGGYAGAALLEGEEGVAFQTRNGRWTLTENALRLDDGEAAIDAADGFLRLRSQNGEVVLRRDEAQ